MDGTSNEAYLVETAEELLAEGLGPDGGEGTETVGGLDVANKTNDEHGGSLEDGDGLDDLLLVALGASTVDLTDDVGHASLVANEGSKVSRLAGIVLREAADLTTVLLGPLARHVSERTAAGR